MKKNISHLQPVAISPWRHLSLGSWRPTGDSSTYVELSVSVAGLQAKGFEKGKGTAALFARIMALAIAEHPSFNRLVRWGRVYQRRDVDVFILRSSPVPTDDDLDGFVVRDAASGSWSDFARRYQASRTCASTDVLKAEGKRRLRRVPGVLMPFVMNMLGFVAYTLNIHLPGAPQDPFGSVQISEVGSLGIDFAFAPIAPYTRIPMVVTLGRVSEAGQMRIGLTFDHRLIDGRQIGGFVASVRRLTDMKTSPIFD